MRIMAISTAYQFFPDRVPEWAVSFRSDILMAAITEGLFLQFGYCVMFVVHRMAACTGHIIRIVKATLPVLNVGLMTIKADIISYFSGGIGIFPKGNQAGYIDIPIHIQVVATGAMTDFTAVFMGSGCP
jgi:hypothetical protein